MSANECRFLFEDTGIGQLKERIYNLSDAEIESFLGQCEIPSPGELDKPGWKSVYALPKIGPHE